MKQYHAQLENFSELNSLGRKLNVQISSETVNHFFNQELLKTQKRVNLKGFRPGQAPLSMIKKQYAEEARHKVFHELIDTFFQKAISDYQVKPIGGLKLESYSNHSESESSHGSHAHHEPGHEGHNLKEDQDFSFSVTFEVFPEIKLDSYMGLPLTQQKVVMNETVFNEFTDRFLDSHAELIPVESDSSSCTIQLNHFVDVEFEGALVDAEGLHPRPELKGKELVQVGGNRFLPEFEKQLVGLKLDEESTFEVQMPADYFVAEIAEKKVQFKVKIHGVKEKKLPTLDEEFVKGLGFKNLEEFRNKVEHTIKTEKARLSKEQLREDLLNFLIKNHSFDLPQSVIHSQRQMLINRYRNELKRENLNDAMIAQAIDKNKELIQQRAERQARVFLLLESIADAEKIKVSSDKVMQFGEYLLKDKNINPSEVARLRNDSSFWNDIMLTLKQEEVIQFLLSKAIITEIDPI